MAGEVWVLDIVWHVLLLAPNAVVSFWSSWSMEFMVLVSLFLHISLAISAELRWHGGGPALKFFVWLFYVCADYVGTSALGSLSVSSATGEHQLVALWGAFFLLHLGGPDSITAYSVEDSNLSLRDMLEALLRVVGAGYVVWTSVSGSWSLVVSAWLMLVLGASKYGEKVLALYRANLDNIRRTVEKEEELVAQRQNGLDSGCGHCYGPRPWTGSSEESESESEYLQEEAEALLYAHSLFENICVHAMVDASDVKEDPAAQEGASTSSLLDRGWKDMCKVVEMQLSLMYDVLYTKAAVIHTCPGYCIRVLAPIFTATAFVLFELSDPDQGGRDLRADIIITRVLLGATLLLETAWLFRALGSSWAASALCRSKRRWSWLRHAVLCSRRWHRLHRALASLGSLIISTLRLKGGYRRWSGSMGQFNLLRFCSTRDDPNDLCSMLAKMLGVEDEDWWTKFRHSRTIEIPECVKRLLFQRVKEMLEGIKGTKKSLLEEQRKKHKDDEVVHQKIVKDSMDELDRFRTQRGEATLHLLGRTDLRWSLGDELQEGILTWHIATHVFLFKSNKAKAESAIEYVKAIGTLSRYMMFLLAFRPDMLPGLALRSLYKLTCQDLLRLSSNYRNRSRRCGARPRRRLWGIIIPGLLKRLLRWHGHYSCSSTLSQGEGMLASILCGDYSIVDAALEDEGETNADGVPSVKEANQQYLENTDSIKSYIPLGSKLADELPRMEETETPGMDLLQAIFNVWVEMLLCSSYRCSRESHAKHLSNGGELTTIVWLTVEHAGLFPIDKDSKVSSIKPPPPPPSSTITVTPDECEATGIGHSEVNICIYGRF